MDFGSEYAESDESSTSQSEMGRRDRSEQEDNDEMDPRDLMTSPPPLSPSQVQQHPPSSSKPITSRATTISRPEGNQHPNTLSPIEYSSANSLNIPSILSTNAYGQGPDARTYFTRPNRFFGAPATWKSWTQTERDLAKGIDRARATDLTLHLCGAFALRRELAEVASSGRRRSGTLKAKGKGKARANNVDGDRDESHGDDSGDEEDNERNRAALVSSGNFALPRTWTVWPMLGHQVPREELLPRLGAEGECRARPDMRPSAALEECLIATVTKLARERWSRRDWQDDQKTDDIEDEKADSRLLIRHGSGFVDQDNGAEDALENDHQEDLDPDRSDPGEENSIDDNAEEQSEEQEDDPDYPMFTSQPYASPISSASETGTSSCVKKELDSPLSNSSSLDLLVNSRPVPLADDRQARELFLPSARHILARLDALLLGLHKARAAYAGKRTGKPRGRSSSQLLSADPARSASLPRTPQTTEIRGRGRSRGNPLQRDASSRNNDADGEDDEDDAALQSTLQSWSHFHHRTSSPNIDHSTPSTPQFMNSQDSHQKRKRPVQRTKKLPPRDWSDVVGMAALAGWDPNVVQRASERCAGLFGENMLFRTFFERESEGNRSMYKVNHGSTNQSWYTEQLALDDESPPCNSPAEEEQEREGQTVVDKIRTSAPCTQCREGRFGCMAPGNEDNNGNNDVEASETRTGLGTGRVRCKRCTQRGFECSGITVRENRERVCPHQSCERHDIPFRKMYHLRRHLNAIHADRSPAVDGRDASRGRNRSLMRRSTSSVGASSGCELMTDTDRNMDVDYAATGEPYDFLNIDGQSRDTIVCPVFDCKRHRIPFSRGVKLYDHVRRMHPHVDVEALKKSETSRRGEHRGRPKSKSKSQSQSQSRSQSRVRRVPFVQVQISEDPEG
ncbi:uncharacterized protein A1O9_00114 [Exophiala aquamarina CBS 119918]|uniref:Rrn9 domain-containing protein n=1 Tax=Exophiala aquamarina CBS 119918 TaxID=1182545 RepID=A0A072PQW6_9EURO|nr:uncharacterized protein A1O9_00114 [Exophiala aquamarina CBS 119918]KEF62142.1 hypothetical protein A1O9_00114 [Exophiala aquamarina CBS 119918]